MKSKIQIIIILANRLTGWTLAFTGEKFKRNQGRIKDSVVSQAWDRKKPSLRGVPTGRDDEAIYTFTKKAECYKGTNYFMSFREMIRRKGYSAFSLLHVVVSVNFIPCWAEAIGCVAIVKKVGAGINRFGLYFNKVIFACVGSPAQTLVIAW